jgi:hypothetical protein
MGTSTPVRIPTISVRTGLRYKTARRLDKYPELGQYPVVDLDKFKKPVVDGQTVTTFNLRHIYRK